MIVTETLNVGRVHARHTRALLDKLGATWVEHRGWPKSSFVITANEAQWDDLLRWVDARQQPASGPRLIDR